MATKRNKIMFYEFSARPVSINQINSFHKWMKNVERISWETNYDSDILQGLLYVEEGNSITEAELEYISQWFLDNKLTLNIAHKIN